jgi:NADH-quinone oxidoreductase subunit J
VSLHLDLVTGVFGIFAVIALGAGVLCVSRRSPVASALWLVVTMFSLAVLFVILDAQFLAVMQVLVYAGAIMVLFLFVIMLLNLGRGAGQDRKGVVGLTVGVVLAAMLFVQLRFLRQAGPPALIRLPDGVMAQMQQHQGLVGAVAGPLYDAYLVPFEITSVLLLAAVVGAVVLAKRKL